MINNKIYTAADIHQYLSGKMDASQMHAIEKAALDDPFLAEAIEGYNGMPEFTQPQGFNMVEDHLNELREKINPSTPAVKRMSSMWRAAAAILLLLGGTVLAIYLNNNAKNKGATTVAKNEPSKPAVVEEQPKDTPAKIAIPDETNSQITPITEDKKQSRVLNIPPSTLQRTETSDDEVSTTIGSVNKEEVSPAVQEKADVAIAPAAQNDNENEIASAKGKKPNMLYKKADASKAVNQIFSGKVIDKNNNPIPYATITTSTGLISTTDKNGEFSLPVSKINAGKISFKAKNYQTRSVDVSENYQTITLDSKKIISDKKANGRIGEATILYHKGAEPKEGWLKYTSFLVNQISYSEYDTGKPVVGETIVSFEINANLEPVNFIFEKQIDTDVNNAVEELIKNGPEWKITDPASVQALIRLKLIF